MGGRSQAGIDARRRAMRAVAELPTLAPRDSGCWHISDPDGDGRMTLCGLDCGPFAEHADRIDAADLCATCRDIDTTFDRTGIVP